MTPIKITKETPPLFNPETRQCWLWDAEPLWASMEPKWHRITEQEYLGCDAKLRLGWTHWHPDQPAAPTELPGGNEFSSNPHDHGMVPVEDLGGGMAAWAQTNYKTQLTRDDLVDAVTNLIDEGIRKSRYENYDEWQAAVAALLVANQEPNESIQNRG
jgi:hypothetical protein